eukprot:gene7224-11119_t
MAWLRAVLAIFAFAAGLGQGKIVGAKIESCTGCRLNQLPQLRAFLHGPELKKWPAVEMVWIQGAPPTMVFINEYLEVDSQPIDLARYDGAGVKRLLNARGITEKTPKPVKQLPPATDKCVAFRATSNCNSKGQREPNNDVGCKKPVFASQSGYCECIKPDFTRYFGCLEARGPFTCDEACRYPYDTY